MAPRTLHKGDGSAPTEAIAQPCDEFEPGGSAADDYDAVCILVSVCCHALLICARCIMNSLAVHCFRHLLHSEYTRPYEQDFVARVASMANSAVVGNDREPDCQVMSWLRIAFVKQAFRQTHHSRLGELRRVAVGRQF
jgi:hypothetical protein